MRMGKLKQKENVLILLDSVWVFYFENGNIAKNILF